MPRVFRQQYTRPIPEGAEHVTIQGKGKLKGQQVPAVRFKGADGKTVVAPLTTKGKNAGRYCRVASSKWYGWVDGQAVPLCTNKVAAEQMLSEKVRHAELGKVDMVDKYEAHKKRPLAEHLGDFRAALVAKGATPEYFDLVVSRIRALLDGVKAVFVADLDAARVSEWLSSLRVSGAGPQLPPDKDAFTPAETAELLGVSGAAVRAAVKRHGLQAIDKGKARRFPRATVEALVERATRGHAPETVNHYVRAVRSFMLWMVRAKRLPSNPLNSLPLLNAKLDVRHARRELTADELRRLLGVTRASGRSFRGLTGPDRFHLYAAACGTGFRAAALASLTPESFDLGAAMPAVTLPARFNKSRKTKVQPLPTDVADLLRGYLQGKPAGRPVWGGTWARDHRGAEMLRGDLEAAGIPYTVEGPDGPEHADFHALRHTYLTLLGKGGVDLRTAQELAGHSSPEQTAHYSHRRLHDLAGAVGRLPDFLPNATAQEAARATETDGAYSTLTSAGDAGGASVRLADGTGPNATNPFRP
jgi:excisionase family DNA binding protein